MTVMLAIRPTLIFPFFWVGLYAVNIFVYNFTSKPNQIYWCYVLVFFAYSTTSLWKKQLFIEALKPVVLYWIYLAAFYVVSNWELIPGSTARYLPFHSLEWLVIFAFFAVGYHLSLAHQLRVTVIMALMIALWTALELVLFPDLTRYGYGVLSMILLPFLLAYRRFLILTVVLLSMTVSNHMTPLIAGGAALLLYIISFYRFNVLLAVRQHLRWLVILLVCMVTTIPIFWARMEDTLGRFTMIGGTLAGADLVREYIIENSFKLLADSKGIGIGYMNFYVWSGLDTGYSAEARTGSAIEGFNIHNSFMTWGLEGGILVVLSLVLMSFFTYKKIHLIYKYDRRYGAALIGMIAAFFIFGMAHQLHMATQFWAFIGLVWGYSFRIQSDYFIAARKSVLLIHDTSITISSAQGRYK